MKTHKLGVGQFVELVEQCCADVEAMGFNCVEATKKFFQGNLQLLKLQSPLRQSFNFCI